MSSSVRLPSTTRTVAEKLPWPKTLAEQAQAVRAALAAAGPVDVATLAKNSRGTKMDRIEDILKTLARLGQARGLADNRYVALGVPITCFGSFPMHG